MTPHSSQSATYCSSKHPHEPEIPPALDSEGRCLVCCQLVRISDLERDLGLERESHETTKRMLDEATIAPSAISSATGLEKRYEEALRYIGKTAAAGKDWRFAQFILNGMSVEEAVEAVRNLHGK